MARKSFKSWSRSLASVKGLPSIRTLYEPDYKDYDYVEPISQTVPNDYSNFYNSGYYYSGVQHPRYSIQGYYTKY